MKVKKAKLAELIVEAVVEELGLNEEDGMPDLTNDEALIDYLETASYHFMQTKNSDAGKMVDKAIDYAEAGKFNHAEALLRKVYFKTKDRVVVQPIMYLRDKLEGEGREFKSGGKDHPSIKGRKKDYAAMDKIRKDRGWDE